MPRTKVRMELYLPADILMESRRNILHDIGKRGEQRVRAGAPGGYDNLKGAVGYRITNQSGRLADYKTGNTVDLKPRRNGPGGGYSRTGKAHPLYHIAEGGRRRVAVAGWNAISGLTGAKFLFIPSSSGEVVAKGKYAGQRGIFTRAVKGYRGTRFLRNAIFGGKPLYAQAVYKGLTDAWNHTKRESL